MSPKRGAFAASVLVIAVGLGGVWGVATTLAGITPTARPAHAEPGGSDPIDGPPPSSAPEAHLLAPLAAPSPPRALNGPGPTTSGRPLAPVGPLAASAPEHRQADAALLADVARALRGPVPEPILALLARAQAGEAPATLREEVAAMRDLELRVLLTEWLDAREGLQQSPAAERPPAGPGGAGTLRRR